MRVCVESNGQIEKFDVCDAVVSELVGVENVEDERGQYCHGSGWKFCIIK